MKKYIDNYLYYNEVILGKSYNTIRSYKNDLSQFLKYLEENENIDEFSKIEIIHLRSYIKYLSYQYKSSKRTINRKVSALRSFFEYLVENRIIEENKAIYVETPKFENKLPNFLIKTDLDKIRQVVDTSKLIGLRDRVMIEMLYSSGLRSFELLELSENMIDFENRELRVIGKGNKERITFFSKITLKYLNEYIKQKKENLDNYDNNIVFVNSSGQRLTTRSLRRIIEKYGKMSGINKELTPRVFRHTFATELLNNGVDIRYVQELLGHSTIATTQFYTHISKKALRDVYLKTHPFAKGESDE